METEYLIYQHPTGNAQPTPKSYVDTNCLKLSGGTVTGHIIIPNPVISSQNQALSRYPGNTFFVQIINPYAYNRFNNNNLIIII